MATIVSLVLLSLLAGRSADAQKGEGGSRWAPIRRVFGQKGEIRGRYFRINLPRTDLKVRIGDDALSPRFEFTSYVGFIPAGASRVMAMGELVLRGEEVPAVLREARRMGVRVSAVHNHLIGENPRIIYVHILVEGAPQSVALKLRSVFAKSATPLAAPREERSRVDWSAIDAVLGPHAEAEGRVAAYVFPRREPLSIHGMVVQSTGAIETASEVVFQKLGGGRTAVTGELFVRPGEVDPVVRALDERGLHITAVHNHMIDDTPRMYWVHWYATGKGTELARGVAAALMHMNSERRSTSEGRE